MLDYLIKYALPGALIVYLYNVIKAFAPLFKEDFKDRDYFNLALDTFLLLLFPFSMLSATRKYTDIVINNPEALCCHDYKEFNTSKVDDLTIEYKKCTKCGHMLVTAKKEESEDANICE